MNIALEPIRQLMQRRNYSPNTIETYLGCLHLYHNYCVRQGSNPANDAHNYLMFLVQKKYSISYQNQNINAIKFYWEHILGKEKQYIQLDRPMKEKRLPEVMSLSEIEQIFAACNNPKHLAILKSIYACGLRIGELIRLKISDVDSDRMLIKINQSKGRKDRLVPLPEELLSVLRHYYKLFRPHMYLFEGQYSTKEEPLPYSSKSIQNILKACCCRAKIKRKVTPHTLRHSYATHLYEHGVNLRSIQVLLGHNSSKTTEIYTHVSTVHLAKVPSPLSFLAKTHTMNEKSD